MKTINPYLTFNGNCREAMAFYKKCLGGTLTLQTIEDSPMAERMPQEMKKSILHATLINDGIIIMGSDMVDEKGLDKGNSVSIMLHFSSEQEIKKCYKKLSSGGQATHPLEDTFWGALFGGLTDKYGVQWLLNYSKS